MDIRGRAKGEPAGEDAAWLGGGDSQVGAIVGGRWTYEAAGHWGGENPWGLPFFIVTHRPEEEPRAARSRSSPASRGGERAVEAAGDKDVHVMGGADVIRQALEAGLVDELTIIVAPGRPRRRQAAVRGVHGSLDLEHLGVRQSQFATFIDYRVKR